MINKEKNTRIAITLPKKQVTWLNEFCNARKITPSKFIKYMLCNKIDQLYYTYLHLNSDDKLQELIEIAATPWLDEK